MPQTIDDSLLDRYLDTFVGCGSFSAPFWFVGMEPGGGHDLADI